MQSEAFSWQSRPNPEHASTKTPPLLVGVHLPSSLETFLWALHQLETGAIQVSIRHDDLLCEKLSKISREGTFTIVQRLSVTSVQIGGKNVKFHIYVPFCMLMNL